MLLVLGIWLSFVIISFFLDSLVLEAMDNFQSPLFDYVFSWISYTLSLVVVLLFMTSLFMWEENKKDWIIPLWFSFVFTLALTIALKFIVARDRPYELLYLFGFADYSFPSAHAAVSFSVVPILDEEYPKIKWFWIAFAVLVALSRLYLGVHYLSDVMAGGLIGFAMGLSVVYLKKKYSFLE
jgi:undecaprenyl-diphosphatase